MVDSGVSIEQAKRVARAGTKESIMFDAETALPTAILAFVAVGAVVFICNLKKEGTVNKKVIKKTLKAGLIGGCALFLFHLAFNQFKRLK